MSKHFAMMVYSVTYEERSAADLDEMGGGPDAYPTFRVKGTFDGAPFETLVSMELDGRDMEFETVSGPDFSLEENYDAQCELVDKHLDQSPEVARVTRLYYGDE